ncbi:hypothetical protein R1917_00445 [Citrobacter koseri]|uniref:hypothetical protein n=1 Tax=Citrobacter koseri TaxID=545 RepID=UPI002943C270|nr:hypothetical protein [Citrobacter koseri]WOJ30905.1 hypothetical protein R1917_00445 [Citrobacter koseri]WOJ35079.1 hypothetical protein R1243_21505 [Citrobacter koseri]
MINIRALFFSITSLFFTVPAVAVDMYIETEFRPSADRPADNEFTNLTPETGFCLEHRVDCVRMGVKSLMTGIEMLSKTFDATKQEDLTRQAYQHLNSSFRPLIMRDPVTGKSFRAEFRIAMLANKFISNNAGVLEPENWQNLAAPEGGCSSSSISSSPEMVAWAWLHPEGSSTCYYRLSNVIGAMASARDISIGYILRAPNPMQLPQGTFNGVISYEIGTGKDIDIGGSTYTERELNIHISATIQHELKVSIQGDHHITLEPAGGWDAWSGGGNDQFRLEGQGRFSIVASSPVHISAECTHQVLNDCALQVEGESEPALVPLHLRLTIPGMINRTTGEEIRGTPILARALQTPGIIMEPVSLINNAGVIDFFVDEVSSLRMGTYPGSTWKGSATIIFDAAVGTASLP